MGGMVLHAWGWHDKTGNLTPRCGRGIKVNAIEKALEEGDCTLGQGSILSYSILCDR